MSPSHSPSTRDGLASAGSRRSRRLVFRTLGALVVGALVLEVVLRVGWGLGSPVLIEADPEIEYVLKPRQDLHRFGRRTLVNEFGMRSRSTTQGRDDPEEVRVLVLGDSVVNGGVLTDHEELATTLLERRLAQRLQRPVFIGNVSAGSWGPPNHAAYLARFGWFDADAVILVLSSTDAADDRRPPPRTGPYPLPTENPRSAIGELLGRYLLPRIGFGASITTTDVAGGDRLDEPEAIAHCRRALRDLLDEARQRGIAVAIVQHWELPEIEAGTPRHGHELIAAIADEAGVPRLELRDWMEDRSDSRMTAGRFRDQIHINPEGQCHLADALDSALQRLGIVPSRPPAPSK